MPSSYWGYWLVVMGVAIVGLMISVQGVTTSTTQDYLSVKEITEASMLEAVDYAYYRDYNEIKMNKEKFMEVFVRMLSENMSSVDKYEVNFYGIYEAPPKVSVEIKTNSGTSFVSSDYDVVNRLDSVIQAYATDGGDGTSMVYDGTPAVPETDNSGIANGQVGSSIEGSTGGSSTGGSSSGTTGAGSSSSIDGSTSGVTSNSYVDGTDDKDDACPIGHKPFSKDACESCGTGPGSTGGNTGTGTSSTGEPTGTGNNSTGGTTGNTSTGTSTGTTPENQKPETQTQQQAQNLNNSCVGGNYDTSLKGVKATPMLNTTFYADNSLNSSKVHGSLNAGSKVTILAESGNFWAVDFNGKCGWVSSDYMGINLVDYIPEMDVDIFNAKSAQYKSNQQPIGGITGKQLYSNDYMPVAVYSFAKKLKYAAGLAKNDGKRLLVNDAYRPYGVTKYIYSNAYNDPNFKAAVQGHPTWFLAKNFSKHNTGCAVDITLVNGQMPTAMHELGMSAMKYSSWGSGVFSSGVQNSYHARLLHNYMTQAGLQDLQSEWWHYQDDSCHSKIGQAVYFWSAV